MADLPLVSVVIPLYNKGPYIARALNSVLAQTFQDFEVIVVDDGSTDDGADIVKGFNDPRIQLIQQENQGVSAARNRGIEAAQADLIAFLDSDDEWLPMHLATLLRLKKSYPEAGMVFTSFKIIVSHGKIANPKFKKIPPPPWEGVLPSYFLAAASCSMLVSSSSAGVLKEILIEIKGFNEDICIFEDSELWGRIALKYPVAFSWECGSIYHCEAINRSFENKKNIIRHPFIEFSYKNIDCNGSCYYNTHDLKEYIERLKLSYAIENVKNGNPVFARPLIKEIRTKINRPKKVMWYAFSFIPPPLFRSLWRRIVDVYGISKILQR